MKTKIKKYILTIFSLITLHNHAMEVENEKNEQSYTRCWFTATKIIKYIAQLFTFHEQSLFAKLPVEITNRIADQLLFKDFETEKEFIERTQKIRIKKVPKCYLNHLPGTYKFYTDVAYCPNNKIIALFDGEYITSNGNHLLPPTESVSIFIIDREKNTLLSKKDIYARGIFGTAISRDGNLVGFIDITYDSSKNKNHPKFWQYMVTIHNMTTRKSKDHIIPHYFEPCDVKYQHPILAFNKQGTHFIVHGNYLDRLEDLSRDEIEQNPMRHYRIIPLTVNTPDANVDYKKTLAQYFAQRGICKDLYKQLQ
jgi:hypothetical protein